MFTKNTIDNLSYWIGKLKNAAEEDTDVSIFWFGPTAYKRFSIVGGWMKGFSESYKDLFCMSASKPEHAMCVKIAVNEGNYVYNDFESLKMPVDRDDQVEDLCIAIEQEDDTESLATFLLCEWERIMEEHGEEIKDVYFGSN